MSNFKTEQEEFWAGGFGDKYIDRNRDLELLAANTSFFAKIIERASDVRSIIEFGANIGLNLIALRSLLPQAEISAIEINSSAVRQLKKIKNIKVYHQSILDFKTDTKRDLVFTKGVLIHINPEMLKEVYGLMYKTSKKYICIAEYYNPSPVSLSYRGEKDRLFKRDFAGEIMDMYILSET